MNKRLFFSSFLSSILICLFLATSPDINAKKTKADIRQKKEANQQPAKAKYIFYFIGDGMGMGHVNTTETYRRDVLKTSEPLLLYSFDVGTQLRTYSHNRPITDSAAAGTALSTGHKTNNSMIGMNPDSVDIQSISSDFIRAGYNVGVATTVAGDDATPSAFYAHVPSRKMCREIGEYAINSDLKFLGAPLFKAQKNKNGEATSWEEKMVNRGGYTLVRGFEEFLQTPKSEKILMLATETHNNQAGFTIDSIPGALTLKQLTEACLQQVYTPTAPGFFMMVEAGNIDWAAHANDGGAVIKEILNFQKSIEVAYNFYNQHPDETLIIVTADHDTGGMALGRQDSNNKVNLALIDAQKISKDRFSDQLASQLKKSEIPTWEEMKRTLSNLLGFWNTIPLTEEETAEVEKSFFQMITPGQDETVKTLYNDYSGFTELVFSLLNKKYGIGFTTHSHTANPVPLFAIGAGSDLFKKPLDNTDVPQLILRAAGFSKTEKRKK